VSKLSCVRLLGDSCEHEQVQGTRFKMTSWSPFIGTNRAASEKVIVFYGLFVHLPVLATGILRASAAFSDQVGPAPRVSQTQCPLAMSFARP